MCNHHLTNQLTPSYLFTEVARRIRSYRSEHPDADLINLSIGDVRGPLAPCVMEAMHCAVDDQAHVSSFHGYDDERGAKWLRQRITEWDYQRHGIAIESDEVFVSAGAADDLGNLSELFSSEAVVLIPEPTYPEYKDVSLMAGRKVITVQMTPQNDFIPPFPLERPDIIYLCSPNNPTGSALTRDALSAWVVYARQHGSVIIFDAAYEAYIHDADVPHSIYACEGATECAIEVKSFSKSAGFTGLRCGYTVCPKALTVRRKDGLQVSLNALWRRRQCTKTNGVSYITMRGAEAVLSERGEVQTRPYIEMYVRGANLLRDALRAAGWEAYGGVNSPYVWCRVPEGYDSWSFFDYLLQHKQIVCVPGIGFGEQADQYVRLAAFTTLQSIEKAIARLR